MKIKEFNVNIRIGHLVGARRVVEVEVSVVPDAGESYTVMKPELLDQHDFESRLEWLIKRAGAQVREVFGAEADLNRSRL